MDTKVQPLSNETTTSFPEKNLPTGFASASPAAVISRGLTRDFNFKDVHLSELVHDKHNMIRALNTYTLEEAMELMRLNNISSIPIYNPKEHKYIGLLDYFDIMCYVAFGSFKKQLLESDFENVSFGRQRCEDFLGISREGKKVWRYDSDDSLESVLETLTKGVHRIMVNKPAKTKRSKSVKYHHRILSQSDIVKYLYDWASGQELPMLRRRIDELHLIQRAPVTVKETLSAIDAFKLMYQHDVFAVAVVNEQGQIIANLSATDLRYLTQSKLTAIFLPIMLFLQEIHGQRAAKPITCQPHSTFEEVLFEANVSRVKRIWITNANMVPMGVITLTDMISKFAPQDVTLAPR